MTQINKKEFKRYVNGKVKMRDDLKVIDFAESETRAGFLIMQDKLYKSPLIIEYFDEISGITLCVDSKEFNTDPNSSIAFIKIKDWIESEKKEVMKVRMVGVEL